MALGNINKANVEAVCKLNLHAVASLCPEENPGHEIKHGGTWVDRIFHYNRLLLILSGIMCLVLLC